MRYLPSLALLCLLSACVAPTVGPAAEAPTGDVPTVVSETPEEAMTPTADTSADSGTATAPSTIPMPPQEYQLRDVTISLTREPCFGFCPVYSVTLGGDGQVVFDGSQHVEQTGRHEAQVSQEDFVALLETVYAVDYFRMAPEYREETTVMVDASGHVTETMRSPTDMPTQIVKVKIGDYEKQVVDYWGAPQGLKLLENKIDQTADVGQWVGANYHNPLDEATPMP
jgi:hypothetical protein